MGGGGCNHSRDGPGPYVSYLVSKRVLRGISCFLSFQRWEAQLSATSPVCLSLSCHLSLSSLPLLFLPQCQRRREPGCEREYAGLRRLSSL